jgi:hypothetical protein
MTLLILIFFNVTVYFKGMEIVVEFQIIVNIKHNFDDYLNILMNYHFFLIILLIFLILTVY